MNRRLLEALSEALTDSPLDPMPLPTPEQFRAEFCIPPKRKRRPSETRRWLRRPVSWYCSRCDAHGLVGPTSRVPTRCKQCRNQRWLIFTLPPHA